MLGRHDEAPGVVNHAKCRYGPASASTTNGDVRSELFHRSTLDRSVQKCMPVPAAKSADPEKKKILRPLGEKYLCANFQNKNICARPRKLMQLGTRKREPLSQVAATAENRKSNGQPEPLLGSLPRRPERHPLPRFGSMIRLLIIYDYEATPKIFPIFPRTSAAGRGAIAAHMLGLWSSVTHGAPHERRGRNAIHRARRVEITRFAWRRRHRRKLKTLERNPQGLQFSTYHTNRWSREIQKIIRATGPRRAT